MLKSPFTVHWFIPSGIPATDLLRHARCQLIVTPFPPEGPDIYQSRLFDDRVVCFFDGDVRSASAPLPFDSGTVTMYMVWHRRDHLDPARHISGCVSVSRHS